MLLNSRTTRLVLEAAEDAGFAREDILGPLGLRERDVVDPQAKIDWSTLAEMMTQISSLADGDVERLREVGRRMGTVPSYAPLQRLAQSIVSARRLYEIAIRWIAPVNFPHLPLRSRFIGERRLVLQGEIPAMYAPCVAFFHIFEGTVVQLPLLIGEEPSTIVESRVSARAIELVVDLPKARTAIDRIKRTAFGMFGASGAMEVLETQRQELAENIEALRRARDELRVVLDRLPDLVVVHVEGSIVWVNRSCVLSLGYESPDDLIGSSLFAIVAPEFHGDLRVQMKAPARATGDGALHQSVLQKRDGEQLVVEVAGAQSVVFDGVSARLVLARDVSERARMQQKLIVADRLASIGLLAAGVAHEVNNPLGYVLNNIEIARKELANLGEPAAVARQVLGIALEGVDRIRFIVRDLLMLARGDDASIAAIDVRSVAESTLALAGREIERVARLKVDFQEIPLVVTSESRIAQILLNLIANALEAMRERPREDNVLTVSISASPTDRVRIEVSDTGHGIESVDLARVFEPFFTTKPAGKGTGLGLAIAQRLVVEMGGEIAVTSIAGKGTTFRVFLPIAS